MTVKKKKTKDENKSIFLVQNFSSIEYLYVLKCTFFSLHYNTSSCFFLKCMVHIHFIVVLVLFLNSDLHFGEKIEYSFTYFRLSIHIHSMPQFSYI